MIGVVFDLENQGFVLEYVKFGSFTDFLEMIKDENGLFGVAFRHTRATVREHSGDTVAQLLRCSVAAARQEGGDTDALGCRAISRRAARRCDTG
jgi:hypothetical protein